MQENPVHHTYQLLHQVVSVCHAHDVNHVVLCPGSRSAPLALSFMRFEGITHFVIPDERSAAYMAMGIARQTKKPVALVCTSGTAALNFAPAIAEAYFSEIPLIVFTADRPVEWLGQADNQAIYQAGLYGKNVKASFNLPTEAIHPDTDWYAIRIANEALNTAKTQPKGPVHINVPLREPLYMDHEMVYDHAEPKIVHWIQTEKVFPEAELENLRQFKKVLVVSGTHRPNKRLAELLSQLSLEKRIVFVPDITSNLNGIPGSVSFAELVIDTAKPDEIPDLIPDLVISFGGPIVSKTLKNFLRQSAIREHWHLSGHPASADTFQLLSKVFDIDTKSFLGYIQQNNAPEINEDYVNQWTEKNRKISESAKIALENLQYGEPKIAYNLIKSLPENTVLHLGNSLPIRYASVFPFIHPDIEIHANRGTSGIDGTVSTAAGQSMVDNRQHVLICGDLSFMYDSHGLWNNYLKDNLKIIVFNNHGGGIFRTLPGARIQKELEEYFAVKQPDSFDHIALQHHCHYFHVNHFEEFKAKSDAFFAATGKPAVLEIEFNETVSIQDVKKMIYANL